MNNRTTDTFTWSSAFAWALAIVALLASSVLMAEEAATEESRVSVSSHFLNGGRSQATPDFVSTDEYDADSAAGQREHKGLRSVQQKASGVASATPNIDFWFYTVDVILYGDDDRDGYHTGIDLLFDADTIWSSAEVYAVLYLSLEGGPWTEYAVTENFYIFGTSATDEYVIVSDLVSGYPTGSYDILIELFDAWDDSFVADIGPESTSELAFLPLEDEQRDAPVIAPQPVVVVNRGGGGAVDVLTLAAFAMASVAAGVVALRRRRRPGSDSLAAIRCRERSS